MARKLGLRSVTVFSDNSKGKATAFGTLPTRRKFEIAGIFDVGMFEYDSSLFYAVRFGSRLP